MRTRVPAPRRPARKEYTIPPDAYWLLFQGRFPSPVSVRIMRASIHKGKAAIDDAGCLHPENWQDFSTLI